MTTPDLTPLERSVLLTMATGEVADVSLVLADLASETGSSETDVLSALAALTEAGLIRMSAVPDDADRLPRDHRVVLLRLLDTLEAGAAEIAADIDGGEAAAAKAIAELTAADMVEPSGTNPGAVYQTEAGWTQAQAEITAGAVADDPVSLRLLYGMWATVARQAEAAGRGLGDVVAEIAASSR